MSQNVTVILLVLCGVAVFSMLLGVFLYKQFRRWVGRFFIIGIVNRIIGDTKEDVASEGSDMSAAVVRRSTHADIRAKAQSLDFDAALAKYQSGADSSAAQTDDAPRPAPPLETPDHIPHLRRRGDLNTDDDDDDS